MFMFLHSCLICQHPADMWPHMTPCGLMRPVQAGVSRPCKGHAMCPRKVDYSNC